MDGFLGYNQIKITSKDQHKMNFTTPWRTFFYQVIPFGLKNIGATYQWAMTIIFHDLLHEIMEDYVDDILRKSKNWDKHIIILIVKIFERLEKYKLSLNPKKCVFGVTSDKLLGFIVSHRGNEVDPVKVKAIMGMPPLNNVKQLHSLQGKLQSIHKFIAQIAYKYHAYVHLMWKETKFMRVYLCQKAFKKVKEYLASPPILMPPIPRQPILLIFQLHQWH